MANNRLYLRDKESGIQILFAKYYPNTGWFCYHSEECINTWLDKAVNYDRSPHGSTNLELVYEELT